MNKRKFTNIEIHIKINLNQEFNIFFISILAVIITYKQKKNLGVNAHIFVWWWYDSFTISRIFFLLILTPEIMIVIIITGKQGWIALIFFYSCTLPDCKIFWEQYPNFFSIYSLGFVFYVFTFFLSRCVWYIGIWRATSYC